MKTLTHKMLIHASPETVFATLDDLGVTGMHMTQPSAMMGGQLRLTFHTP